MNRYIIILVITFFFINSKLFCNDSSGDLIFPYIGAEFSIDPYFYDTFYRAHASRIEGNIEGGVHIGRFSVGGRIEERYFTYNGKRSDYLLDGAFNFLVAGITFSVEINKWFILNTAIGSGWRKSAFTLNSPAVMSLHEGGLLIYVEGVFPLVLARWQREYIRFYTDSEVGLYFSQGRVNISFRGGGGIEVHPYVEFLSIFIGARGNWFSYRNERIDIKTGFFSFECGISFHMEFKARKREGVVPDDTTPDTIITDDETDDPVKRFDFKNNRILRELHQSARNSIIKLDYIYFKDGVLTESSRLRIDDVAAYMNAYPGLVIGITGYSEYYGDPVSELDEARKRAGIIREYLVSQGVARERIKLLTSGILYEDVPYVEIKIIARD